MTENETEHPPTSGADTGQSKQNIIVAQVKSRNHIMMIAIVMLLAMGFVGAFYLIGKIKNVEESVNLKLDNTASHNDAVANQINTLNNEIDQLQTQTEAMTNSIASLYQQEPVSNEDWALSEIEYLLIIATHRIVLERDVDTALVALEAAELRLRDLSNADLVPVREQFVADINKLKAVNHVDITGLSIYLADIIDRASSLPLKKVILENNTSSTEPQDESINQEQNESVWRDFLSTIWQELKSLVVIKRRGETRQALLLPDQEYFLYQNLRLELENARLSVLRRDTENLRTSVNLLVTWLNDYFNTSDAAVSNVIETFQKMSVLDLKPDLPDINSSLETLRAYMRMSEPGHSDSSESGSTTP